MNCDQRFTSGTQPGNNYRVAAALAFDDLNLLNVTAPQSTGFVPAGEAQPFAFPGMVSPMLTVWRKLHIEVDSMEAVATSGAEANFETGTIDSYVANSPATGLSTINLDVNLRDGDNAYENGRIEITGIGTFNVLSNQDNTLVGDDVVIDGTPGTAVIGKSFKIYDDDDNFLSEIGLPPLLPADDWSTNIVGEIRDVFFPAYIDVTNANAMGLNTAKRIPFKRSEEIGLTGDPFDANKNVAGSEKFWAHTICFGYQTKTTEDADPDTEAPTFGITPKLSFIYPAFKGGISAIYLEVNRDVELRNVAYHIGNTNQYVRDKMDYINRVAGTIAHEIGHAPGGQAAGDDQTPGTDHGEGGIMTSEGVVLHNSPVNPAEFAPATVRRFRKASLWSE